MNRRPDKALVLAAVVVGLDLLTKALVFGHVDRHGPERVFPGLKFEATHNRGVAFSLLSGQAWLIFGLIAAAIAVLIWFYLHHRDRPGLWIATGLMLGGAIGNAIDRIFVGYVRDFVQLPAWPTFNLADVALALGVVVLIFTYGVAEEDATRSAADAKIDGDGEPGDD